MLRLLSELTIGPLLVAASTVAARRWGAQIGGVVSALPAVVGPVLLIASNERGAAFAARAADGTLLGLVALSGFVVTYARVATRARWEFGLLAGWICAGLIAALLGWLASGSGLLATLGAAAGSLLLAHRTMPPPRAALERTGIAAGGLPVRMAATAVLVISLAAAGLLVGAAVGGMLAALPVLASVLAVFTHRQEGREAMVALLRGMLVGMTGFVGFCAVVAWLIVPAGKTIAFGVAAVTALGLQALVLVARPTAAGLELQGARTRRT